MNQDLLTTLHDLGMDTEAALRRFAGNTGLYQRFLLKFLEDETMEAVRAAVESENWEAMLMAAHTLKGVAGNLGLNPIFDACAMIVTSLRNGDTGAATSAYPELEASYGAVRAVLEKAAEEGSSL